MVGINFNTNNKAILINYLPGQSNSEFDILVESLPEKDEDKSDMIATLYKDDDDNLYWQYEERPVTNEERISDLEMVIADLIGGTEE